MQFMNLPTMPCIRLVIFTAMQATANSATMYIRFYLLIIAWALSITDIGRTQKSCDSYHAWVSLIAGLEK